MPFKSPEQRAYLHANEPEIAKKWEKEMPAHYKTKTGKAREKAMREHEESMEKKRIRSFKPKKKKKGLLQKQGYY